MTRILKNNTIWLSLAGLIIAVVLPLLFSSGFAQSVMVLTAMFIVFALSYDLSIGHVGTVHLAPPAFFGLGAYVTALLGPKLGLDFAGSFLISALAMAVLAFLIGIPSFRLSDVTFAIATLAFALISQLVVLNAVDITGGPLCVKGISRPSLFLPGVGELAVTSNFEYYYLLLPLVFVTILVYRLLTTSRIGRAFVAVREDEVLASASAVNPLRYKMLAFIVGAAIAGALGSFQAQYITVVCPTELALDFTLRLLIIIFVGGAGSLSGVLGGAIIFTVLPELMRSLGRFEITPAHQLILFGLILLLVITYSPDGLKGIFDRWLKGARSRFSGPASEHSEGDFS